MSPYYPPCKYYYKLPEDFILYLKHFSCYGLMGSGELYKLYLDVHRLAGKKALLKKIVPIWKEYDRIHTDGYSLGIIMMECYILLQNVQHSKQASVYLEVAKGLTDVNNPMSTAYASQRLQEIYAITTGGRKPRCVKRTNKKC